MRRWCHCVCLWYSSPTEQLKGVGISHVSVSVQPRGLINQGNWCYIHAVSSVSVGGRMVARGGGGGREGREKERGKGRRGRRGAERGKGITHSYSSLFLCTVVLLIGDEGCRGSVSSSMLPPIMLS